MVAHRKGIGKATYRGSGTALVCTSVAYWGRGIMGMTWEQSACCRSVTRMLHVLGYRLGAWAGWTPFLVAVCRSDFPPEIFGRRKEAGRAAAKV